MAGDFIPFEVRTGVDSFVTWEVHLKNAILISERVFGAASGTGLDPCPFSYCEGSLGLIGIVDDPCHPEGAAARCRGSHLPALASRTGASGLGLGPLPACVPSVCVNGRAAPPLRVVSSRVQFNLNFGI